MPAAWHVVKSRRSSRDHRVPGYGAGVAELVDAAPLQRDGRKPVGVELRPLRWLARLRLKSPHPHRGIDSAPASAYAEGTLQRCRVTVRSRTEGPREIRGLFRACYGTAKWDLALTREQ